VLPSRQTLSKIVFLVKSFYNYLDFRQPLLVMGADTAGHIADHMEVIVVDIKDFL